MTIAAYKSNLCRPRFAHPWSTYVLRHSQAEAAARHDCLEIFKLQRRGDKPLKEDKSCSPPPKCVNGVSGEFQISPSRTSQVMAILILYCSFSPAETDKQVVGVRTGWSGFVSRQQPPTLVPALHSHRPHFCQTRTGDFSERVKGV